MDPVDDDADPQVLARPVASPLIAGADQDGRGLGRLRLDPLDPPAQFAGREQRVDQLQVVVGKQRAEQRADGAQGTLTRFRDLRYRASLSHPCRS